jgi:regulator of replication initiation timing
MNKTVEQHQKDILDKTLFELPCSYIPNHTYENIPDMVAYYVKENNVLYNELEELRTEIESYYSYYAGFAAGCDLSSKEMLDHILKNVPNYKPTKEERDLEDMTRQCAHYIKALQEITKKNRKAETCRMIALKALGELDSGEYQPELLIEENLALKMKVEDLESQIISSTLEKIFPTEAQAHPLMHCQDCGELLSYHHEEYCEAKVLDNAYKHSKMYP